MFLNPQNTVEKYVNFYNIWEHVEIVFFIKGYILHTAVFMMVYNGVKCEPFHVFHTVIETVF